MLKLIMLGKGDEVAASFRLSVASSLPAEAVRAALARLADIVLPPLCLACRAPVHSHGGLCPECWARVDFIQAPLCDRLGIPLPYAVGERIVSAAAMADPPVFDRARAVAAFGDVTRDLVHAYKYRDRQEGLALFARWMARAGAELIGEAHMLVPVPLYRLRLWRRRFNQSALLAERIGRLTGVAYDPFVLQRTRRTASQVGLTVEQRQRNVAGAFAVPAARKDDVKGAHILLIDDVLTTGATANACARTLKRAGAAQVDVLTLARVVDPLAPRL